MSSSFIHKTTSFPYPTYGIIYQTYFALAKLWINCVHQLIIYIVISLFYSVNYMGFFLLFIFYTSKSLGQQKKKMWIHLLRYFSYYTYFTILKFKMEVHLPGEFQVFFRCFSGDFQSFLFFFVHKALFYKDLYFFVENCRF